MIEAGMNIPLHICGKNAKLPGTIAAPSQQASATKLAAMLPRANSSIELFFAT